MRARFLAVSIAMICPVMVTLFGGEANSREFSATITVAQPDEPNATGRIFVADQKVRTESPEAPKGFFLFADEALLFVKPELHTFMDAKQSSFIAQIFVPVDREMPCRNWQAMAVRSGAASGGGEWLCNRVGEESMDGRSAARFEAVSPRQERYSIWVDAELSFPLRVDGEDGSSYRLERIVEQQQPPELFLAPIGYVKFEPEKLIERIKQSDVWVEPPHEAN
jgi:hypothetical protein